MSEQDLQDLYDVIKKAMPAGYNWECFVIDMACILSEDEPPSTFDGWVQTILDWNDV